MTGSVINCFVNEHKYSFGMGIPVSVVGTGGDVTTLLFVDVSLDADADAADKVVDDVEEVLFDFVVDFPEVLTDEDD